MHSFDADSMEKRGARMTLRIPLLEHYSRGTLDTVSNALRIISDDNEDTPNHDTQLIESINMLKILTKSVDVHTHRIDEYNRRILPDISNICNTSDDDHIYSRGLQIEHISEAIAKLKQPLILNDMNELEKTFPDGVTLSNDFATNFICIPIIDQAKARCIMVIELYRENNTPYTQNDINLALCSAKWIGMGIVQVEAKTRDEHNLAMNMHLSDSIEQYFLNVINFEECLSRMMNYLKDIFKPERIFYYKVDVRPTTHLPQCDLYEDVATPAGLKMKLKIPKYKFHRDKGLASQVVRSGLEIDFNATDSNMNRLDSDLVKIFKITLNCSLCYPIKNNEDKVVGVLQLVNKTDGSEKFTETDHNVIKRTAVYLTLAQNHDHLKELFQLETARFDVYKDVLGVRLNRLATFEPYQRIDEDNLPEGFDEYDYCMIFYEDFQFFLRSLIWYPEKMDQLLVPLMVYMFRKICGDIITDEEAFFNFILNIKKCYRPVPFRNFFHAFSTVHTAYWIFQRTEDTITQLEITGIMLVCLFKCINSEGYNSNYYALIKHPITLIHEPPQLRMHRALFAKQLLTFHKILLHFNENDRLRILKVFVDVMIFTSAKQGEACIVKLRKIVDENKFDPMNPQHINYRLGLIQRIACKTRFTKPFRIGKRLCEDIYREMFNQGDKMKAMKIEPSNWMNRDNVHMIQQYEVDFITKECLPTFELLKKLYPETNALCVACRELRKAWTLMIELGYKKAWNPDESIGKSLEDSTKNNLV